MKDAVTTVMEQCDLLANISEEPGLIHRPYGSKAMHEVNDIVAGWMRMAGMTTGRDQIGNLIGRYEGRGEKPSSSVPTSTPCGMQAGTTAFSV
jgi:allantoate deiminase